MIYISGNCKPSHVFALPDICWYFDQQKDSNTCGGGGSSHLITLCLSSNTEIWNDFLAPQKCTGVLWL